MRMLYSNKAVPRVQLKSEKQIIPSKKRTSTKINNEYDVLSAFLLCSTSPAGGAIDNKIEQAMVSTQPLYLSNFNDLGPFCEICHIFVLFKCFCTWKCSKPVVSKKDITLSTDIKVNIHSLYCSYQWKDQNRNI